MDKIHQAPLLTFVLLDNIKIAYVKTAVYEYYSNHTNTFSLIHSMKLMAHYEIIYYIGNSLVMLTGKSSI